MRQGGRAQGRQAQGSGGQQQQQQQGGNAAGAVNQGAGLGIPADPQAAGVGRDLTQETEQDFQNGNVFGGLAIGANGQNGNGGGGNRNGNNQQGGGSVNGNAGSRGLPNTIGGVGAGNAAPNNNGDNPGERNTAGGPSEGFRAPMNAPVGSARLRSDFSTETWVLPTLSKAKRAQMTVKQMAAEMQEASARKTKVKVKDKDKGKGKDNRCRDGTVKVSVDSVEALIEVAETKEVVVIKTTRIGTVAIKVAVIKTMEIETVTIEVETKGAANKELKAQALQALKRNPIPAILHKKCATFFRISPPNKFNPLVDLRVKKSVPARELLLMAQTEVKGMARDKDKGLEATKDRTVVEVKAMGVAATKEGEVRTAKETGGLATRIRMDLEAETTGVVQEGALVAHRTELIKMTTKGVVSSRVAALKREGLVVVGVVETTVEATSAGMMEASTDRVECLVATSVVGKTEAEMEAEETEAEETEEEETEEEEMEVEEMVAISVVGKTEALEARIADSVAKAKAEEEAEEMEEEEMVEEDSAITTTTIVETAVGAVVMEMMVKGAGTVATETETVEAEGVGVEVGLGDGTGEDLETGLTTTITKPPSPPVHAMTFSSLISLIYAIKRRQREIAQRKAREKKEGEAADNQEGQQPEEDPEEIKRKLHELMKDVGRTARNKSKLLRFAFVTLPSESQIKFYQ
ncbi:hypothetical protein WR25_05752 [Diploscapter pachys]|uniref:Uncharacterized protein n=1 Tax=Diploscapter pachys TaxID=2018661 RepID=A0A2A2J825_9BILA|nr:hypothetical protein WR25_05752 [Diploscapter pachys]